MKPSLSRSEKIMNPRRRCIAPARLAILAVLCLVTVASLVKLSRASIGTVTKADLSGSWQGTFFGSTGCGKTVDVVPALIIGRLCLYDGALEDYRGAADLGSACARRCSNSCTVWNGVAGEKSWAAS